MRRARESTAKMHATPPLIVREMDPIADHPGLGPMYKRRGKVVVVKKAARTRTKVKVDVEVKNGETT